MRASCRCLLLDSMHGLRRRGRVKLFFVFESAHAFSAYIIATIWLLLLPLELYLSLRLSLTLLGCEMTLLDLLSFAQEAGFRF